MKCRMAHAQLRDDGDAPIPRPPPVTADQLVAAIARLYRQLPVWSGGHRPSLAYAAIEAQIRTLGAQHWRLTGGVTITDAEKSRIRDR